MLFSRSTGTMPRPLGIAQHDPRAPRSSKRRPVSSACSRNYRTMSSSRGSLSSSKALREPKEVAALRRAKFRGCSPWKAAFRFGLELVPAVQRAAQRRKLRLSSRNGDSTDSHRDAGKRRPPPNRTVVAPASAFLFQAAPATPRQAALRERASDAGQPFDIVPRKGYGYRRHDSPLAWLFCCADDRHSSNVRPDLGRNLRIRRLRNGKSAVLRAPGGANYLTLKTTRVSSSYEQREGLEKACRNILR